MTDDPDTEADVDAGAGVDTDSDDNGDTSGPSGGYRHVVVDDLPNTPNPTRAKREVDEAVGATEFGFNVFEADPGERLPWGYHSHPEHEELFYVVAGTVEVDTPEVTHRVETGEAFFVPPNHPNRARAVGSEPARVLAVGAPKASDEAVVSEPCPNCGDETDRTHEVVDDGETYVLSCAACGGEADRFGG
ncbi:cupin domain-containing protein [Halobium salinum]|uniref:Cupin domain-containing protein n=1 Tax=Halobium salinum TaxID=1364940 RepID=A0ABD5PGE9_9EURY|nr:cupin domain-containing protein [Halobium salinum]